MFTVRIFEVNKIWRYGHSSRMLANGRGQTALYVQVSCKKKLQSWHQSQINIGFTHATKRNNINDVFPKQ